MRCRSRRRANSHLAQLELSLRRKAMMERQDSVVNGGPITKHSNTEQVLMMHTLKTKTSKYQSFIDKAFQNIMQATDEQIIEVVLTSYALYSLLTFSSFF
ncbi:hypothetical protein OESDEN_23161 [Oesophagostomum dentatum]|uniref:Uncharacterized protein n=1 Tax=Oesophagostomum dentatum TaxID=61180 RepID=A0A0B1RX25_OESDE|nr:hypothetical protein OESDEN_23161 [Oesophagostomum dentatum]